MAVQREIPLPLTVEVGDLPLVPARMVNEYVYCPRLAYLEWVQKEWAESYDTVQGSAAHRRVDKKGGDLPAAEDAEDATIHARSVTLSSVKLGVIAKLDLIEGEGDVVVPVDYKKGKRPHVAKGAYEPELVQLCLQGLILQEHGYTCDEGVLYFVASKERVKVPFDETLCQRTISAVNELRALAHSKRMPPPLEDSPKCPRCSLVGICLPDEVNYFRRGRASPRPLFVHRDERLPLFVQAYSAKLAKKGEVIEVYVKDKLEATARLGEVSQVIVFGNAYITTPCLTELMRRNIPVSWHSFGGWFYGHTIGNGHGNVELRTAQYAASFDETECLRIAKAIVDSKIANQRTLLRRNWKSDEKNPQSILNGLSSDRRNAEQAESLSSLLGFEGSAASRYFGNFEHMITTPDDDSLEFDFSGRNRRPPMDPVNALLSLAYAVLTRAWTTALAAIGMDPYRGFYHQPRFGRPALALDMMEAFRPIVADSAVLTAINNGEVHPSDFVYSANACNLRPEGRKRFLTVFERRMSQEITHPLFGYRLSYRRLFTLHARLFARYLMKEFPDVPVFTTR